MEDTRLTHGAPSDPLTMLNQALHNILAVATLQNTVTFLAVTALVMLVFDFITYYVLRSSTTSLTYTMLRLLLTRVRNRERNGINIFIYDPYLSKT